MKLANVEAKSCAILLPKLGVFGWNIHDETCAIAALLTGDPVLMIGTHGCAKTMVAGVIAKAIGRSFVAYDASKVTMEEYTGMYDIEALKKGEVKFIDTPNTIWGKQFLMLDEINRALPDSQGKWLEVVRSRTLLGTPTGAKWVWSAMNPVQGYSGTNMLEPALAGRFAFFLYPTPVLEMEEGDRENVVRLIGSDDAPALSEWRAEKWAGQHTVKTESLDLLNQVLRLAAEKYALLLKTDKTTVKFVTQFAEILAVQSKEKLILDGRRLGLMYRSILSSRAVSLAWNVLGEDILPFKVTAREVVARSIPRGITEGGLNDAEFIHVVDGVFKLLEVYFEPNGDLEKTDRIFRLFTERDPLRLADMLLTENLPALAKHRAWGELCEEDQDETVLLAYIAIEMEALVPGLVPSELIDLLGNKITVDKFNPMHALDEAVGETCVYHVEFEQLLERSTRSFDRLYALYCIRKLLAKADSVTSEDIAELNTRVDAGVKQYSSWLQKADDGVLTPND